MSATTAVSSALFSGPAKISQDPAQVATSPCFPSLLWIAFRGAVLLRNQDYMMTIMASIGQPVDQVRIKSNP